MCSLCTIATGLLLERTFWLIPLCSDTSSIKFDERGDEKRRHSVSLPGLSCSLSMYACHTVHDVILTILHQLFASIIVLQLLLAFFYSTNEKLFASFFFNLFIIVRCEATKQHYLTSTRPTAISPSGYQIRFIHQAKMSCFLLWNWRVSSSCCLHFLV